MPHTHTACNGSIHVTFSLHTPSHRHQENVADNVHQAAVCLYQRTELYGPSPAALSVFNPAGSPVTPPHSFTSIWAKAPSL